MTAAIDYALGSTDLEHQRLMVQGRYLRPWTDRFLRLGGLRTGMSVLDLGSGLGDVGLLAAEIVGPGGRVVGIDRDEVITAKARLRMAREALGETVTFEVADLAEYEPAGLFDAVIGRYVLLYQPDPVAVLRRFARFLRPGGVMIFHEQDMTEDNPSWPPCPAWDDCYRMFSSVISATGAIPDFGRQFSTAFLAAGLPLPVVEATKAIADGPDSPMFDWIARTLSSLGPVLTRVGLTEVDLDDVVPKWRAAAAAGTQMEASVQYGAWARLP